MVDEAPSYSDAVKLIDEALAGESYSAWGSWGQYDYNQIQAEKARHGLAPNFFDLPHLNLKAAWQAMAGKKRKAGVGNAIRYFGMEFEGTQHRAFDDVKNMARILPHIPDDYLKRNIEYIPRFLVTQREYGAVSQVMWNKYKYVVVEDGPIPLPKHF